MAQRGLDDISETIGNIVVPETQQGSTNSTTQNAREEQEASSSSRLNIVNLPAYSAWLKRAEQFEVDPIFQKEDTTLVQFNSVDSKANYVTLKETDITPVSRGWGMCLLGRFAGRFPGKEAVFGLMKRWPCKARVTFHRRGWMFFQFGSDADMEKTRQKGPYHAFGTQLVLQSMPDKFDPDMEPEVRVPVWLRLVDLPLELWNLTAVSKIGSFIGTPLSTDFRTLRRESMDGPRIQVTINTAQRPREAVTVQMPSGDFIDVKVEYEYLPSYCPACKNFGHIEENCPGSKDEWQLVGKNVVMQKPKSRSRSKSVTRQPNARSKAPPHQQRTPTHSAQQAGPSSGQGPRQQNQWKQNGGSFSGARPQQVQKGKSVLGNIPESSNKFEALVTENETDHLVIRPPPTMAEFFTAYFEMAGQQERVSRGRSQTRDPRRAAMQTPQANEVPPPAIDPLITEVQIHGEDDKKEAPPEGIQTIERGTLLKNNDVTEPADVTAEQGEQSERQDRSSKKKGDGRRRKSRSKSRTKGALGGEDPDFDPGPCQ